jgi:hypothetical protein
VVSSETLPQQSVRLHALCYCRRAGNEAIERTGYVVSAADLHDDRVYQGVEVVAMNETVVSVQIKITHRGRIHAGVWRVLTLPRVDWTLSLRNTNLRGFALRTRQAKGTT